MEGFGGETGDQEKEVSSGFTGCSRSLQVALWRGWGGSFDTATMLCPLSLTVYVLHPHPMP